MIEFGFKLLKGVYIDRSWKKTNNVLVWQTIYYNVVPRKLKVNFIETQYNNMRINLCMKFRWNCFKIQVIKYNNNLVL